MSDYHTLHIIELFAATIVSLSLISILINSYFREKLKIFRGRIFRFILLIVVFLLNVIFATINLINPIKVEIYNIVAPLLLTAALFFGLIAIKYCIKKINKFIIITNIIMILILIIGVLKISIFGIESIIFILFGLFFGTVFLSLLVVDFLIYLIGGKKRKIKIYISKKSRKKVLGNALIILIVLIVMISSIFVLSSNQKITNELVIYSWYDYFTEESIDSFEKEFGVNVTIYNFGDELTMEKNIADNSNAFDLVIMPDEYVKKLRVENKLERINKRNIPRMKNIGKEFLNKKYDPQNQYSVPYLWGTTGILSNKNYIKENDTWGIFFDEKYENKVFAFQTPTDFIGIASSYLGYGYVPTETSQLLRIEQFLKLQKRIEFYYDTFNLTKTTFRDSGIWASQFYGGDAIVMIENNPNLTYTIPKEGAVKWIDNFVILRGSKNKVTAEVFINHILDPIRSAAISNMSKFPIANTEAMKYVDQNLLSMEAFNPSPETFEKLVYVSDFDSSKEMDMLKEKLWEKYK